jgi:hypothetical protein
MYTYALPIVVNMYILNFKLCKRYQVFESNSFNETVKRRLELISKIVSCKHGGWN